MFNEYVYASQNKVRQFVPVDESWWSRLRVRKIAGKVRVAPLETSVELEPVGATLSDGDLEQLVEHLSAESRWYRDDDLIPGTWVHFEGRIGCQALPEGAAIFCEAGGLEKTTTRIMLHGSAANLLGTTPSVAPEGSRFSHFGAASSVVESALANAALPVGEQKFWGPFGRSRGQVPGSALAEHVGTLFREVACHDWYYDESPYLAGCARVSAVVRPQELPFAVVVASPLFVRHSHP
ncbi:hypothetical protein SAMN04488564_106407 [Lentzea waywayandensis]|uniref:Uncharacterized protein n=1 Tax=Lentzea waywayandensis TaxID=84724 RepID=A0A1I6EZD1_9PSEU|nr:SAVMC3_10250 family protein [Lentzea waywayandensis]SFR22902.1 hypothetical protein SAMN04488564_106407 [Lentzea waywayandensis]